jgi:hypothetical protein
VKKIPEGSWLAVIKVSLLPSHKAWKTEVLSSTVLVGINYKFFGQP